jgi:hypothetical protein
MKIKKTSSCIGQKKISQEVNLEQKWKKHSQFHYDLKRWSSNNFQ